MGKSKRTFPDLPKFIWKIVRFIKKRLAIEIDRYREPERGLLSQWFESLYSLLLSEEKAGNISYKNWYQKSRLSAIPQAAGQREQDLTESSNGMPLYKVKILNLPEVVKRHKKFRPQISEPTFDWGIFPETLPEILSWRLDLAIFDSKDKKAWPEITFNRYQYKQPEKYLKHEIRYNSGRELTAYEVKFIKSIFDLAILKLARIKVST